MKTISFTQVVKEEIVSLDSVSSERRNALLSSFIKTNGVLRIRDKKENIILVSQNAKIAKYIYNLLKQSFAYDIHLSFIANKRKKTIYQIEIGEGASEILETLHISFMEGKIPKEIAYDDETIAGYLTGIFLSCGSVNSPKTSNYHLELVLVNENYAKWLSHLFGRYNHTNIEPKLIQRRDKYVLYFKKSDQIADFLLMIGAVSSCMEFENVRIDRDYTNNANRLLNLDTANMGKTIVAGKRQQKEISYLVNKIGLEKLGNKKVVLVAKIRLENESMPLEAIANKVSEELGLEVSKSNVNHIFRKIHERYIKEHGH